MYFSLPNSLKIPQKFPKQKTRADLPGLFHIRILMRQPIRPPARRDQVRIVSSFRIFSNHNECEGIVQERYKFRSKLSKFETGHHWFNGHQFFLPGLFEVVRIIVGCGSSRFCKGASHADQRYCKYTKANETLHGIKIKDIGIISRHSVQKFSQVGIFVMLQV